MGEIKCGDHGLEEDSVEDSGEQDGEEHGGLGYGPVMDHGVIYLLGKDRDGSMVEAGVGSISMKTRIGLENTGIT